MPTDTKVNDLKINVLSEAQYEQIQSPSATELYLVPEVVDTTPTSGSTNPITSGGVYAALQNIPAQEQSDWNETDTTDPAFIKNKPQNIVTDANYVHTDNNYTTTEKSKLADIEAGAEANVQSDWSEADTTSDAYILHKPDLDATLYESVTYSQLVTKINNSQLVKGRKYRITDYVTTTVQTNTSSAGHAFDLVVTAIDVNKLDCKASAMLHSGDTYFSTARADVFITSADLSKWQIWYDVENNNRRFRWADTTNGKGVIYRMIDEWGNDCPYDFKNILFTIGGYTDVYTFNKFASGDTSNIDHSFKGGVCYGNVIKQSKDRTRQMLNFIVFNNDNDGSFCYSNIFGDDCAGNVFGSDCRGNIFGENCSGITFGNNCTHNTIGKDCGDLTFGGACSSNTFGNNCHSIIFGDSSTPSAGGDLCKNIIVEEGNWYIRLYYTASNNYLQNIYIAQGCSGTSNAYTEISTIARGLSYRTTVGRDSSGNIRIYNEDDPASASQAQANWNETNSSSPSYIQNKPTIPTVPTHRTVNHEQITDSSLGDANLHDGFYFPNAVQDYDGNWYGAVVIGDQVWLASNLRTTHYADGTAITKASTASATAAVYLDNSSSPIPLEKRGYHYNYFAFSRDDGTSEISSMTQGIAPNGWHIPTYNETQILKSYLNRQSRHKYNNTDNYIAKSIASTDYWGTSETVGAVGYDKGANNSSGFNALPCGTTSGNSFSSNTTVFWSGRNAAVGTKPMIISASSTTITTTTSYGAILACSVRCVSNLTPLQFRDWYVKTYGTMQHNIHPMEELSDVEVKYTLEEFKKMPNVVADYDGNTYGAVIIGNQVWMTENLRTTHYPDGTEILNVSNSSSRYVPFYYNNETSDIPLEKRGLHYNWYSALHVTTNQTTTPTNLQGVAPEGWHIPTYDEYEALRSRLTSVFGNASIKAMVSKDTWTASTNANVPGNNPSTNDESMFGLVANGLYYFNNQQVKYQHSWGDFWVSTQENSNTGWSALTQHDSLTIYRTQSSKYNASAVRCIYDGTPEDFINKMNKQVLVYDSSKQAWVNKNVAEALPSMSGNSGKVLAVNGTETDVEWVRPVTVYSGSSEPSTSLGEDGDIFILAS